MARKLNTSERDEYLAMLDEIAMWDQRPELDALHVLTLVGHVEAFVEKKQAAMVAEARNGGASWDAIGSALGISRQAAWERFK